MMDLEQFVVSIIALFILDGSLGALSRLMLIFNIVYIMVEFASLHMWIHRLLWLLWHVVGVLRPFPHPNSCRIIFGVPMVKSQLKGFM